VDEKHPANTSLRRRRRPRRRPIDNIQPSFAPGTTDSMSHLP